LRNGNGSAGFQTCRIADFQIGEVSRSAAGLETCDTADLEVCGTNTSILANVDWFF
jgi:hypothetical protein